MAHSGGGVPEQTYAEYDDEDGYEFSRNRRKAGRLDADEANLWALREWGWLGDDPEQPGVARPFRRVRLDASLRHAPLRARAAAWRDRVEAILAAHLRDRDAAAMAFAAWQGQVIWGKHEEKGFRLKDLLKRLG